MKAVLKIIIELPRSIEHVQLYCSTLHSIQASVTREEFTESFLSSTFPISIQLEESIQSEISLNFLT